MTETSLNEQKNIIIECHQEVGVTDWVTVRHVLLKHSGNLVIWFRPVYHGTPGAVLVAVSNVNSFFFITEHTDAAEDSNRNQRAHPHNERTCRGRCNGPVMYILPKSYPSSSGPAYLEISLPWKVWRPQTHLYSQWHGRQCLPVG